MPFRLRVPPAIYEAMIAHARAELPNECCGLLAGTLVQRVKAIPLGKVVERYPLKNAVASPVEYLSDGESMFAAHRDMRRRGLDILAVYHSHPSSPPVPSRKDRERNYSEDVMNLIISMESSVPLVQAWWLTRDTHAPAQWECMDDDPHLFIA